MMMGCTLLLMNSECSLSSCRWTWDVHCVCSFLRMCSHTIVYFYIRTSENLANVGSSRHKLPRHLQYRVGDTDPSGQNWSDMPMLCRHVATCRHHFQLSGYGSKATRGDRPASPYEETPCYFERVMAPS